MTHAARTEALDSDTANIDHGSNRENTSSPRCGALRSKREVANGFVSERINAAPSLWHRVKAKTPCPASIRQGFARGRDSLAEAQQPAGELGNGHPADGSLSERLLRQSSRAVGSGMAALRGTVMQVDDQLSRLHGVRPFTTDTRCLLRFSLILSPASIRLSDGVSVDCGSRIVDLHLWNEHIPPAPKGGPNLAWALQLTEQLRRSLEELARAFGTLPELNEVRACRARTNFVGRGCSGESLSRIVERYGFEEVDEGLAPLPARFHDLLENVLIGALVWTHNPEALRRDKFIRERRPVWISRERLLRLHGER